MTSVSELGSIYLSIHLCIYPYIFQHNDISHLKIGSKRSDFDTFYIQMCFAPQWRALARHLNFQEWSKRAMFYHFDLEMWLAPQHSALTLTSFAAQRDSPLSSLFAHLHLLPSDFRRIALRFFSLTYSSAFLLCFSSVRIVGSFTAKLPSTSVSIGRSRSRSRNKSRTRSRTSRNNSSSSSSRSSSRRSSSSN